MEPFFRFASLSSVRILTVLLGLAGQPPAPDDDTPKAAEPKAKAKAKPEAKSRPRPEGVTKPPPFDEFLVLPLRVHLLKSDEVPDLDCRLSDSDIRRIVGKVNRVWGPAGIHFVLESIQRENAVLHEDFKKARESNDEGKVRLDLYRLVVPDTHPSEPAAFHVYYLRQFSVNGVYFGNRVAVVKDTATLKPAEGGIDEPLPRVTSHELGHALGLPHRQDRTNLLASGTTGILLSQAEIDRARSRARAFPGCRTAPEILKDAQAAEPDSEEARRLLGRLDGIPGAPDESKLAPP